MSSLHFTQENPLNLPGLGLCTGTVEYDPGFDGSYWEPSEEGGIESVAVKDAFGVDLSDEFVVDNPPVLAAIEAAVAVLLEARYEDEAEAMYEEFERQDDVPF